MSGLARPREPPRPPKTMEFSPYSASRTRRPAVRGARSLPRAANWRLPGFAWNGPAGAHPGTQTRTECIATAPSGPLPLALQALSARTRARPAREDVRFLDSLHIVSRPRSGTSPGDRTPDGPSEPVIRQTAQPAARPAEEHLPQTGPALKKRAHRASGPKRHRQECVVDTGFAHEPPRPIATGCPPRNRWPDRIATRSGSIR